MLANHPGTKITAIGPQKNGEWGHITAHLMKYEHNHGERSAVEAKHATMMMMRRDEGRKIGKERKQTYSVQLSTCKLVDLVDVHGEMIDDGAGYGLFLTRNLPSQKSNFVLF